MKKYLITSVIFLAVFLGLFTQNPLLWCSRIFSSDPQIHTIQPGEYFSKLSLQYYGTVDYWRELALINRAPDSDLVFPGEKVIVPALDAIEKIHRSRSLTAVNTIIEGQEQRLADASITPPAEPPLQVEKPASMKAEKPAPMQTISEPVSSSEAAAPMTAPSRRPLVLVFVFILLALAIGAGVWIFIRKRRSESEETEMRRKASSRLSMQNEEEEPEDVVLAPRHP